MRGGFRVLAFLESLCAALVARDAELIRRLMDHPLANALPRPVRDEVRAIANGGARGFVAPLQSLRLYHQTAHLLGVSADPASKTYAAARAATSGASASQIELPLDRVPAYQS